MNYCCPHAESAGKFFSFFARNYRKRFEKKGFEACQKQLLTGLKNVGFKDASILEIGSGVGHLHMSLLENGAKNAVGIDLSSEMIQVAKDWSHERNLESSTKYLQGDFLALVEQVEKADITIMDKVVCCYPDAQSLIQQSINKTRSTFALTYPRDIWYIKLVMGVFSFFLTLFRSEFKPYVHNSVMIEELINTNGFSKIFESSTVVWLTQIYIVDKSV